MDKKMLTILGGIVLILLINTPFTHAQNMVSEIPEWFQSQSQSNEQTILGFGQAKSMDQAVVLALHELAQNIEAEVQAVSEYIAKDDSTITAPENHRNSSSSKVISSQNIAGFVIQGMVKSFEADALPEENLPEEFSFEKTISVTLEQNDGGYHAELYEHEEQKGNEILGSQAWTRYNDDTSFQEVLDHIQSHPKLTMKYASVWEETGFAYYVRLSYQDED